MRLLYRLSLRIRLGETGGARKAGDTFYCDNGDVVSRKSELDTFTDYQLNDR